ncbi:hypothetical protein K2X92_00435 [Candidatus Gracilibacteria bacterium]|nr:hypothetical protein [Candidatus Gracilibacteria bacterium]
MLAFADGDHVTEIDENNLNLQAIAGKRLNDLMILIAESIHQNKKEELIRHLNELSEIIRIKVNEKILAYNDRIKSILVESQKLDTQGNWNNVVVINGSLSNTKGEFIESQDFHTQPSIDMIIDLPISHDAIVPKQIKSSKEREFMLLKIYGISIENMLQVLSER